MGLGADSDTNLIAQLLLMALHRAERLSPISDDLEMFLRHATDR